MQIVLELDGPTALGDVEHWAVLARQAGAEDHSPVNVHSFSRITVTVYERDTDDDDE